MKQWYQKEEMKEQLRLEIQSMLPYVGKPKKDVNYGILPDGRLYWKVSVPIRKKRKDGSDLFYTVYDLLLVYDENHPAAQYGTSIHSYPVGKNGFNEMLRRVRESGREPAFVPHTVRGKDGRLYLCTWNKDDYDVDYNGEKGVPTAAASLLRTIYYLHHFEAGLLSQKHWEKLHEHGTF